MTVCGDSSVPEQRSYSPSEWTCDSREVYESGQSMVSPVSGELVEEMGDNNDLGAPEMVAGPEENPGEDKEVIQDKVGCDVGGRCDDRCIFGEKVPDVA